MFYFDFAMTSIIWFSKPKGVEREKAWREVKCILWSITGEAHFELIFGGFSHSLRADMVNSHTAIDQTVFFIIYIDFSTSNLCDSSRHLLFGFFNSRTKLVTSMSTIVAAFCVIVVRFWCLFAFSARMPRISRVVRYEIAALFDHGELVMNVK